MTTTPAHSDAPDPFAPDPFAPDPFAPDPFALVARAACLRGARA